MFVVCMIEVSLALLQTFIFMQQYNYNDEYSNDNSVDVNNNYSYENDDDDDDHNDLNDSYPSNHSELQMLTTKLDKKCLMFSGK